MPPLVQAPNAIDRALLEKAAAYSARLSIDELTTAALRQISEREGIDFATAVLYDRIMHRESTHCLLELLNRETVQQPPRKDVVIGVVPGDFYKEYNFTSGG